MRSSPFDRFVRIQPGRLPVLDEFGHRLGRAWRVTNERTRIGRRYFAAFIANTAAIAIESIRHPSTTTVIPDEATPSVIVASGDNARAAELTQLAHELRKMREALKVHLEGEDPEKIRQIGVLASAERAARNGDGPAAERHLRQATEWVYLVALSIGAKRTADVIASLSELPMAESVPKEKRRTRKGTVTAGITIKHTKSSPTRAAQKEIVVPAKFKLVFVSVLALAILSALAQISMAFSWLCFGAIVGLLGGKALN